MVSAPSGGEILIRLDMDDKGFRVTAVNAGRTMTSMQRSMDQTSRSVQSLERHTNSAGRKFRDLILILGNLRFALMDIYDIFLRMPGAILTTAGELEKMQQLMTGLSQETDKTAQRMEGLRDFNFVVGMAKTSPFQMSALADSFVKLKVGGVDPLNGSMQALVDSVARFGGNGEILKRASIAIQQMSGKGVISMEELRQQLGEAVPTAMRSMADGVGMSMSELAKVVSTGTLQAEGALQRMFLRMRVDNDGAAAAMMQTWIGLNARLKTEFQLMSKTIADGGFMNETKNAILEILKVMQDEGFRRFASEFGATLGSVVRFLTTAVQTIIEFKDEIWLAIKAFVAYKVVVAGLIPLAKGMGSAWTDASGSLGRMSANYRNLAEESQQSHRSQMEASNQLMQQYSRATVDRIVNKRGESAAIRSENTRIAADYQRLNQAIDRAQVRGGDVRYGNQMMTQRAASESLREMERALDNNSQSVRANAVEIAGHQRELRRQRSTVMANNTSINAMSGALTASGVAARGAAAGAVALNSVLSFVGGWVGVAVLALTALAAAYAKVTLNARESAEAQRRARSNTSTASDVGNLEGRLESERRRRAVAQTMLSSPTFRNPARLFGSDRMEFDRFTKQLKESTEAIAALETDIVLARRSRLEQEAGLVATTRRTATDREVAVIRESGQRKILEIQNQRRAAMIGRNANNAADKAIDQGFVKRENEQYLANLEAMIQARQQAQRKAETELRAAAAGTQQALSLSQFLDSNEEAIKTLESNAAGVRQGINAPVVFQPPRGGQTGSAALNAAAAARISPIDALVRRLADERIRLDAEFSSFDATVGKSSQVAVQIAELWAQYQRGDFDVDGVRPSEASVAAAMQSIAENATVQESMDQAQEAAKKAEKLTQFIQGLRPEYQQAMELLMNPLGASTKGPLEERVTSQLAQNQEELAAYAERMGQTVDAVRASLTGDARKADISNVFAKMAQDTESMNARIEGGTRRTALARAQADNERHRQAMENLLTEARAAGITGEQYARMRNTLLDNIEARSAGVANEFKTPLEKLADGWKDTTSQMEQATVGWANKSADALTEMVMTGKLDFRSLASSVIADLIRMQVQKTMASVIGSALGFFGFADGGIMTASGSAPLKKYAKGGIANSPQLALFGEGDKPEAYVPLPDGRTIPVTMSGGMGGRGDSVQINITVHEGGAESTETRGANNQVYRQIGERVKSVVREELAAQKRPGGMLYT